jgi:hypothetical protein
MSHPLLVLFPAHPSINMGHQKLGHQKLGHQKRGHPKK